MVFSRIERNQNFYWNQNGEIVIVYDKYVVGPGSMGCPEFTVPVEVYEEFSIERVNFLSIDS